MALQSAYLQVSLCLIKSLRTSCEASQLHLIRGSFPLGPTGKEKREISDIVIGTKGEKTR